MAHKYNAILSINDLTDESGEITYPVTLPEVKDWLRLEGFVDVSDPTSDDLSSFDYDDQLITDLIEGATDLIERFAGISLRPKTLEVWLTNLAGGQQLPRGPIGEIASVTNSDLNDLDYKTVGGNWKFLRTPTCEDLIVTYEAGYGRADGPAVPKVIKTELLKLIGYMYKPENRDNDPKANAYAAQVSRKFSRNVFLL